MNKLYDSFKKYKELILYLIFGVLTTLVNYISYLLLAPIFSTTTIPTAIAWLISVLFAYFTNRKFVFESKVTDGKAILREFFSFFGARLFSGLLDVAVMWVFADIIGFNDKVVKLLSNVVVVVFNYIASKLIIFRKK